MTTDAVRTAHVLIEGRVQGVGYRFWTQRTAAELKLAGWVRNRRDGSVEAVFEGPDPDIRSMIAACRQGPLSARVKSVTVGPADAEAFVGFEVRETV